MQAQTAECILPPSVDIISSTPLPTDNQHHDDMDVTLPVQQSDSTISQQQTPPPLMIAFGDNCKMNQDYCAALVVSNKSGLPCRYARMVSINVHKLYEASKYKSKSSLRFRRHEAYHQLGLLHSAPAVLNKKSMSREAFFLLVCSGSQYHHALH